MMSNVPNSLRMSCSSSSQIAWTCERCIVPSNSTCTSKSLYEPERRVLRQWQPLTSGTLSMILRMRISSSSGRLASVSCIVDSTIMRQPARKMMPATKMAMTGSSQAQPVTCMSTRPVRTPTDVQMSARRWRPSASSACEPVFFATTIRRCETKKLMMMEKTMIAMP